MPPGFRSIVTSALDNRNTEGTKECPMTTTLALEFWNDTKENVNCNDLLPTIQYNFIAQQLLYLNERTHTNFRLGIKFSKISAYNLLLGFLFH